MRIKNKYNRNRHFRLKHWKRIRSQSHPFETMCSNPEYCHIWSYEKQVKDHFEWIIQQARALETGQPCFMNSPSGFRRLLNKKRKAQERNVMAKIRQGDYDAEIPKWKNDAAWLYW